jgi:transposase
MLTPGQAHDLNGAGGLLPDLKAEALLADKAYDADERLLVPSHNAGMTAVIPSKSSRIIQRNYDKDLYEVCHLIENFFCKLKQYRAIATRYDKTARNFLAAIVCQEDEKSSCCMRDEGRPFGADLQEKAPNCQELLRVKYVVVNVMVKRRGEDCVKYG